MTHHDLPRLRADVTGLGDPARGRHDDEPVVVERFGPATTSRGR